MKNTAKTLFTLSMLGTALFFTACDKPQNSNESTLNYKNDKGLEIIDNEIFYKSRKKGWISEEKIFLSFEGKTYSFEYENGIEGLDFNPMEGFESVIYYDELTINLPTDKDGAILYECNGPLLPNRTYEYCRTNGEDLLTQYEFGGAYRQFSTGAGIPMAWNKILIKKIGTANIIFEGDVGGVSINSIPNFIAQEALTVYKSLLGYDLVDNQNLSSEAETHPEELGTKLEPINLDMRTTVESKTYLDRIKNETSNVINEKEWAILVNSFSIEKN